MNEFTYLTDKNFEQKRHYVGASDIPTLALLNKKYGSTPLTLWEEKTGRRESWKGNERTKAGKELEPIILKWGLEKFAFNSEQFCNTFLISRYNNIQDYIGYYSFTEARHPKYNFLVAHADLINANQPDKPYIMEAKSTGYFGAKRENDVNYGYDENDLSANGIPSSVYLQIQTQMLCYDITDTYVSVMIDTGIHKFYGPIESHKRTQENILALAEKFWWYVENDKSPKPETWDEVVALFPKLKIDSKTVIAGKDAEKMIEMKERAKKLRKKQKEIKNELEDLKDAVGLVIGGNKYLETSEGSSLATAFNVTKQYAQLKKIEENHPDLFKKLLKEELITESKFRNIRY